MENSELIFAIANGAVPGKRLSDLVIAYMHIIKTASSEDNMIIKRWTTSTTSSKGIRSEDKFLSYT